MTAIPVFFYEVAIRSEPVFNPNGLLSHKVCRYLDQGPTFIE